MTSTAEETMARLKAQAESEASEEAQETLEETEEEETTPKKHGESAREYVVLSSWSEVARVTATTSELAVKNLPADKLKNGSKYIVVPVRNWNEHEVAVETKTTISIK